MKLFDLLKLLLWPQIHYFGGGGSGGQTQNTDPWGGQQPYLRDLFNKAKGRQESAGPRYFPTDTLAPVDPRTNQGLEYATKLAQSQLPQNAQAATAGWNTLLGASDIKNNPNLDAAIAAATAPTIRAFSDQGGPLANIRDQFQSSGQFGGTRQGIAEGIAADRLQQNTLGIGAQMAQQAYQTGLDSTARGLVLTPQVQGAQMAPATTLDAVGQESRTMQQQIIDDMMARFNYGENLPDAKLSQYQNLITGAFGGTTQTQGGVNKTSQAIGLAATGAGLGAYIATGTAFGGPAGAAVGAGVGLIASLFM